jgi:hypothetical protein
MIDVRDFASPVVPGPRQYKIAGRDVAVTFKNLGASPGRYELTAAKPLIDSARDAFRQLIHDRISQLDRNSLLVFCIEQHDALTVEYRRTVCRIRQRVAHEVSYDRSQALADAHDEYIREARNYRYLLE